MRRLTVISLLLCAALLAAAASAQVGIAPVSAPVPPEALVEPVDQAVAWASAAAGLFVLLMNAVAAFVPSTNRLMKIVDAFAFNWGKARNDPALQKWGKG